MPRSSCPKSAANTKPQELKLKGGNEIVFKNVLVGDVWICSGQSNMEVLPEESLMR